jgi:hypothetical protein
MRLLIIFSFAFATGAQAQLPAKNFDHSYTSFNVADRASLANKFKKAAVISEVAETPATGNVSINSLESSDFQLLKKKAIELKDQNDELVKENNQLRQKLATVQIAYLINRSELSKNSPNQKRLQKEPLVIDITYDY